MSCRKPQNVGCKNFARTQNICKLANNLSKTNWYFNKT